MVDGRITRYTDLEAWKKGHELVLMVYKATLEFPNTESFGLTSQVRRAAVSVTSNLAEGFGRFSNKEKARFYDMALGSALEVDNQLLVARDVHYMNEESYTELSGKCAEVERIITGLIRKTKALPSAVYRQPSGVSNG